MRKVIYLPVLLVIFTFLIQCKSKQAKEPLINSLTQQEIAQGWRLLFDGKSLTGWHNFNKDTLVGWAVDSGNLVALGQGGDHANDIITNDTFENFELSFEWKTTPEGNSGVFYLAMEDASVEAIYEIAPEYQIIDEAGWSDTLAEWQKAGACYAMYTADTNKILKPVGEYNISKIVVDHGHVEHWLNKVKVVEYQLWSPDWEFLKNQGKWKDFPKYGTAHNGHIGLQDHGHRTYFRNLKIRLL
jgi:hypothetical protein